MAGKGDKRRPLKVDIKQFDSNWDLKIKITNSSGDTVTKTIVEYA